MNAMDRLPSLLVRQAGHDRVLPSARECWMKLVKLSWKLGDLHAQHF